jgi:uncharacterized protein YdaU (DUF1376 family)
MAKGSDMTGIITVPLHIGDFISGTLHMDAAQKGAYIMLILSHYQIGAKGLPNDDRQLARIAGVSLKQWDKMKPILSQKFEITETFWISSKCVEVLQKVHDKSSAQRAKVLKRYNSPPTTVEPQCYQPKPKPKPNKEIEVVSDETPPPPDEKITKLKKGTRLPNDWELSLELGEWALKEGLTRQQVLDEEESFRDYWIALPGAKGVKTDWDATWRNWIRKSREFKHGKVQR